MEPLGASLLTSLVKESPGLTILAVVTLLLGTLHEVRIFTDVLTLLVQHFRGELAGNAQAFGRLGGALSNDRHADPHQEKKVALRQRKRKVARCVAWLQKRTRFSRHWKAISTRHRRRDVLH